ncbi:MAG: glycosyltransferase family 4 protein [Pseudomonadota bacterium]
MSKIAIYFRMFSPYILARLNAASRVADVVGIEGSRRSSNYAWEPRTGGEAFERLTLFEDRAVELVPNADVMAEIGRVLDRVQPEVVVVGGWSHIEALAMIRWARVNERHVIIMSESTAVDFKRTAFREHFKRRLVRLADAAIVGGQPQRRYITQLGLDAERVFIGYDAVDNTYFAAAGHDARMTPGLRQLLQLPHAYFVASGRFIAKKNFDGLIRAYADYLRSASDNAWDLVLVGDGPLRTELEGLVSSLNLQGRVHFPGFLQYDEFPAILGLAGAFVHVSLSEQWGLVVNEAMASGLPVIVSRQCGCAEDLVEDGVNGWAVDACSTHEIAARLADMVTADRAAMSEAALARIAQYGPTRFEAAMSSALEAVRRLPVRNLSLIDRALIAALVTRDTSAT